MHTPLTKAGAFQTPQRIVSDKLHTPTSSFLSIIMLSKPFVHYSQWQLSVLSIAHPFTLASCALGRAAHSALPTGSCASLTTLPGSVLCYRIQRHNSAHPSWLPFSLHHA